MAQLFVVRPRPGCQIRHQQRFTAARHRHRQRPVSLVSRILRRRGRFAAHHPRRATQDHRLVQFVIFLNGHRAKISHQANLFHNRLKRLFQRGRGEHDLRDTVQGKQLTIALLHFQKQLRIAQGNRRGIYQRLQTLGIGQRKLVHVLPFKAQKAHHAVVQINGHTQE